jgi:hypothetical protein
MSKTLVRPFSFIIPTPTLLRQGGQDQARRRRKHRGEGSKRRRRKQGGGSKKLGEGSKAGRKQGEEKEWYRQKKE